MDNYTKYIGKTFDNRYNIKSLIGNGGMAYVFLADDTVMNRQVAIKVLKDNISSDELAIKRFINETKAISMLSHKNIVGVYDISVKSELKYIAMEYVNGVTLMTYMEEKGILPFAETEKYAMQILSALSHAHSKGIIHRDIKPQNVIINQEGNAKIADFGIAKLPGNETISLSDKAIGTVNYINPEQACGKAIDARSDLYSLGAMLYEMVTGKLPFVADTPLATAYKQIHETPEDPSKINPEVPKGLEQIILKAMKKNPENRFQSANEMLSCIRRVADNSEVTFDFIFDDESEMTPFAGAVPNEISEGLNLDDVSKTRRIKAEKSEFVPLKVNKVQKPSTKNKSKKEKTPKVEVEEIVVHKKAGVSTLGIILGIIAAVMCVCVVVLFYVFDNYIIKSIGSGSSQTIVVGDFTYMSFSETLQRELEEEGYEISVEWVSSSEYLANTIISQTPNANERRVVIPGKTKCQLELVVCSGESMIRLDNYVGMDYREALIAINALGLKTDVVEESNIAVAEGCIISTYPEAGMYITSDTLITIYVSKGSGSSYVSVPSFVGMNSIELELALIKANLTIGTITYEYSDSAAIGTVISQSILKGTAVPAGVTQISFVISLGKEPDPESPDSGNQGTLPPVGGGGEFENDPNNSGYEDLP